MKDYARKFYTSRAWITCRDAYLTSQQYICERCGGIAILAHHKKYITPLNINDIYITLSHDNLEALCQDCHNREHHGRGSGAAEQRFTVTPDGGIVIPKKVYLITGCYGSGKTHYVKAHMNTGDLVVDLDAIFQALSFCSAHCAPGELLTVALDTRNFLYEKIKQRTGQWVTAWVIEALPWRNKRETRMQELGAEHIHINADKETCLKQAANDTTRADKELQARIIEKYWEDFEQ